MILCPTVMEIILLVFNEDLLGIIMTSHMLYVKQLRQETGNIILKQYEISAIRREST